MDAVRGTRLTTTSKWPHHRCKMHRYVRNRHWLLWHHPSYGMMLRIFSVQKFPQQPLIGHRYFNNRSHDDATPCRGNIDVIDVITIVICRADITWRRFEVNWTISIGSCCVRVAFTAAAVGNRLLPSNRTLIISTLHIAREALHQAKNWSGIFASETHIKKFVQATAI